MLSSYQVVSSGWDHCFHRNGEQKQKKRKKLMCVLLTVSIRLELSSWAG